MKLAEKDNMGTRHDTQSLATAYWLGERMSSSRKDPFTMYTFKSAGDARAALLELPCIHVADDSENLICTETLIFGYYTIEDVVEAVLCGDDLTVELWQKAKASFENHGGQLKNELRPTKRGTTSAPHQDRTDQVVFVGEERKAGMGGTAIYRVHRAPDAATAKAFLQKNPVSQSLLYIVVETPEGNYARDIQGIYKED